MREQSLSGRVSWRVPESRTKAHEHFDPCLPVPSSRRGNLEPAGAPHRSIPCSHAKIACLAHDDSGLPASCHRHTQPRDPPVCENAPLEGANGQPHDEFLLCRQFPDADRGRGAPRRKALRFQRTPTAQRPLLPHSRRSAWITHLTPPHGCQSPGGDGPSKAALSIPLPSGDPLRTVGNYGYAIRATRFIL